MLGINTNIAWPKTGGSLFTQQASSSDTSTSKSPFGGAWRVPNMIWNAIHSSVPATPIDDGIAAGARAAMAEADARAKFGPEQAALNLQRDIIQRNLARGGSTGLGPDYRGHDLDLQMLDKELAQLGIDQGAAARQPGLLDALFGVTSKQFQGDKDYLNQLRGFAGRNRDLNLEAIGNERTGLGLIRGVQDRARISDAAARGATVTQGNRQAYQDILDQFNLGNKRLDTQQSQVGLNYDQSIAGYNDQERTLGNRYETDTLNYNENKASAQDRINALNIEAEKYGLKREQLENAFQRGINAMGLQNQLNVESLGDMLASNDIQQQMLARQIADQALRWAS